MNKEASARIRINDINKQNFVDGNRQSSLITRARSMNATTNSEKKQSKREY
ncbi:MAG: hypothetical protein Q8M92_01495 [Candidatus Subteraquimicrobiales bacterium]|nr:hypothetical protein [Candidatus Subteraquimicrobiales bacterium]